MFNDIHSWVSHSFREITSSGVPTFAQATRSFPIATNAHCNKLFTGLVLISKFDSSTCLTSAVYDLSIILDVISQTNVDCIVCWQRT